MTITVAPPPPPLPSVPGTTNGRDITITSSIGNASSIRSCRSLRFGVVPPAPYDTIPTSSQSAIGLRATSSAREDRKGLSGENVVVRIAYPIRCTVAVTIRLRAAAFISGVWFRMRSRKPGGTCPPACALIRASVSWLFASGVS